MDVGSVLVIVHVVWPTCMYYGHDACSTIIGLCNLAIAHVLRPSYMYYGRVTHILAIIYVLCPQYMHDGQVLLVAHVALYKQIMLLQLASSGRGQVLTPSGGLYTIR